MSCGLNHGFRRGFVGTIGLITGIWTALAIVAVGLGAILSASTRAFTALKWLGVAYLVFLGIK
jgi:homoserine/homoserine lactone efflux protein